MIGDEIKRAREARGLSHEALAAKIIAADVLDEKGETIRLSAPAIWRIENGTHQPNFRTLLALASGLRVTFVINAKGAVIR